MPAPRPQGPRDRRRPRRRRRAPGAYMFVAATAVVSAAALEGLPWAALGGAGVGFLAPPAPGVSAQWPGISKAPCGRLGLALRAAEAEVPHAAPNPLTELQKLMQQKIGRPMDKTDLVYTFWRREGKKSNDTMDARVLAQLELACISGHPTVMGLPRATRQGAKRAVAEVVLADPALLGAKLDDAANPQEKTGAEADNPASPKKKRSRKKKKGGVVANANDTQAVASEEPEDAEEAPRIPVADLSIGQQLRGTVRGGNTGGVYVDVGAEIDGYLPAAEFRDGFPSQTRLRPGRNVSVRVLGKEENGTGFWVTRRSGDLARPPKATYNFNASSFAGVAPDQWLDGTVVGMTLAEAIVEVVPPEGGPPVTGNLRSSDFAGAFRDEAALGVPVRVRVKNVESRNNRLYLTMQEISGIKLATMEVGQSFEGKVRSWLRSAGVFVDVGAERDGFLAVEEFRDGFPINATRLKPGANVSVRLLAKDGDRFWFTRRSGDLTRPPVAKLSTRPDVKPFLAVPKDQWLEGEVVRMMPPAQVFVRVDPPSGGEAVQGLMNLRDTSAGFADEVAIGSRVRVRVKNVNQSRNRLALSMRMEAPVEERQEQEEPEEWGPAMEAAKDEPVTLLPDASSSAEENAPPPPVPAPAPEPEPAPASEPEPTAAPAPTPKPDDDIWAFLKR